MDVPNGKSEEIQLHIIKHTTMDRGSINDNELKKKMPRKKRKGSGGIGRREKGRYKKRRLLNLNETAAAAVSPLRSEAIGTGTVASTERKTGEESSCENINMSSSDSVSHSWEEQQKTRDGIIDIFENHLGSPPPEQWAGKKEPSLD